MNNQVSNRWQLSKERSFWGLFFFIFCICGWAMVIMAAKKNNVDIKFIDTIDISTFITLITFALIIFNKRSILSNSITLIIWLIVYLTLTHMGEPSAPWIDNYVKSLDIISLLFAGLVSFNVCFGWPIFLLVDIKRQLKEK